MTPPRPRYDSIPFEEPVFSRLMPDGTPNPRVPQIWVSDGSGRRLQLNSHELSAGCSLLPVQNAYMSLQRGRVAGKQSVYKSELLALVTAAENASLTSRVYCLLDNQSVVLGSRKPPTSLRARCKRSARGLWNRFFAAIEKRNPAYPLEAIWIRGHTKNTTFVHQLHNACDKMAGEATELPLPITQRFPLHEENALIYDHHNHIVEDNIRAAIPAVVRSQISHAYNPSQKHRCPPPPCSPVPLTPLDRADPPSVRGPTS